ncbi:MAG: hypothetical protein ABH814_02740 [bacterium]
MQIGGVWCRIYLDKKLKEKEKTVKGIIESCFSDADFAINLYLEHNSQGWVVRVGQIKGELREDVPFREVTGHITGVIESFLVAQSGQPVRGTSYQEFRDECLVRNPDLKAAYEKENRKRWFYRAYLQLKLKLFQAFGLVDNGK